MPLSFFQKLKYLTACIFHKHTFGWKVNFKFLENFVLDTVTLSFIPETSMVLSVSMACSPVIITDDTVKEEVLFVHT